MRRRTRADEGSRIACDRNARVGVLALAGLCRPRRYSIKPCRMARPNMRDAGPPALNCSLCNAQVMDLPIPARKASGERHAPLRINRPTTTSLDTRNLEPCVSGSTRVFPMALPLLANANASKFPYS